MSAPASVVIVGSGAAGIGTAEALRADGYDGPITIVGDEPDVPYDRPPLSKQVLTGAWAPERAVLFAPARLDGIGADFRLGLAATALDPTDHRLRLSDGSVLEYGALVIATGLRARAVPALSSALVVRTMADALRLRSALADPGRRVVVIGGGFLGLEIAASVTGLGATVTVIEPVPGPPLAARLGPYVAERLLARHVAGGIDIRTGIGVSAIDTIHSGHIVRLTDGTDLPADVVVACVGGVPAVEWLRDSGLDLADGVVCDEHCLAGPDIWAVGDVARWHHQGLGRAVRLEHRTNATEQGRAVAGNILGVRTPFRPVPFVWTDHFDVKIQVAGVVPSDAVAEEPEGDERSFVQTFTVRGRTVGVIGWNAARRMPAHRRDLEPWYGGATVHA